MHWKSVALALCSVPVLAGCGAVRNLTGESRQAHTQRAIECDLRADAHAAWLTVRAQNDRRAFTDEFYDGFLDGFVDYLDRGGAAQPPVAPPIKYVRNKNYYTPEGHCLINDYYLGFKYGTDVATASGRRQFLTVPVLLADPNCPPAAPAIPGAPAVPYVPKPKPKSDDPLPPPRPVPEGGNKFNDPNKVDDPFKGLELPPLPGTEPARPVPPLPKPELPVIKPFNPDLSGSGKFGTGPLDPDLLPVPYPPLPVPGPPAFVPLPLPVPSDPRGPMSLPVPVLKVSLPAPPDAVPLLPAYVPTPSLLDAVPVFPFRHTVPSGIQVPWKK